MIFARLCSVSVTIPACEPVNEMAGTPRSSIAMVTSDMESAHTSSGACRARARRGSWRRRSPVAAGRRSTSPSAGKRPPTDVVQPARTGARERDRPRLGSGRGRHRGCLPNFLDEKHGKQGYRCRSGTPPKVSREAGPVHFLRLCPAPEQASLARRKKRAAAREQREAWLKAQEAATALSSPTANRRGSSFVAVIACESASLGGGKKHASVRRPHDPRPRPDNRNRVVLPTGCVKDRFPPQDNKNRPTRRSHPG